MERRSSTVRRQCDSITQETLLSGANGAPSRSEAPEITSAVPSQGMGRLPCDCLSVRRFGPCRFLHRGSDRRDCSFGDGRGPERRLG